MKRLIMLFLSLFLVLGFSSPSYADSGKPKNDKKNEQGHKTDKVPKQEETKARENSSSDPDDDGRGPDRTNGGPDKPDGNNGCGNDADREDDNEGWCGQKPKPTPTVKPSPSVNVTPKPSPSVSSTPTVVRTRVPVPVNTNYVPFAETTPKIVSETSSLPNTGIEVGWLLFGGIVIVALGLALYLSGRVDND